MLDQRNYRTVRLLLDDDQFLKTTFVDELDECTEKLDTLVSSVSLLYALQATLLKEQLRWSDIYIMAMSNQLKSSAFLETLLASLRKASSEVALRAFDALVLLHKTLPKLAPLHEALKSLVGGREDEERSDLRSGHDLQHSNLRTTIVAQKVKLSQQAANLTEEEVRYTEILDRVHDALAGYFDHSLINPKSMFPVEVMVYDMLSPHRDVFSPRPRFAVERALSQPQDYLGHQNLDEIDDISAMRPAVSIGYEMYLECDGLINAADLWYAFRTVCNRQGGHEDGETQKDMALFERTLAELKYFGMIRHSRKKQDHLAKLTWKGL